MIKKIDKLIFQSFWPPFVASFFISIFVLMMQFLWLWIDDIIGKGIDILIILELLGYLLITFIPMAVPIAILIASVMVFGNLGEHYELSSMKSAGISLTRIMRVAILCGVFLGGVSYLCSDYFIPIANLKYRARLFDIKKQKPTLSLEPGIFNYDFQGYTIRIKDKSPNDRDISGVLIYDNTTSNPGFVNLIAADHGEMYVTDNERFMIMKLYNGHQLQESEKVVNGIPRPAFMRSQFDEWEKVFDLSEFEIGRTDEELFKNHQAMLSGKLLLQAIDTIDNTIHQHLTRNTKDVHYDLYGWADSTWNADASFRQEASKYRYQTKETEPGTPPFLQIENIVEDTLTTFINSFQHQFKIDLIPLTRSRVLDTKSRVAITNSSILSSSEQRSKHVFEYHQKFMNGVVCIIFLFIGVSLGAIVRKGGFGYPLLIAIIFFMIFISTNTTFKKLAETQKMNDVLASWAPCLVLLPFAVWFTYKAQMDAKFINVSAYWGQFLSWVKSISKKNAATSP